MWRQCELTSAVNIFVCLCRLEAVRKMSHAEDWRLVAQWLVKMRVLPQSHKAAQPGGTVIDLGAALRDGVCLCRLLTILNPQSLTTSEYNAHPYNSEVSCAFCGCSERRCYKLLSCVV